MAADSKENEGGAAPSPSGDDSATPATPAIPRSGAPPAFGGASTPPPLAPAANLRIVFAAAWVLLQILLVVTADRRVDGAFGFRMFAESATVKVVLYRDILDGAGHTQRVHVNAGVWSARGHDNLVRRFTWYDRVPAPFWAFDQEMHASYGSATQLARLQAALDDVSRHIPDDVETQRLVLVVSVKRNGHEAVTTQLLGPERSTAEPPKAGSAGAR